MKYPELFRFYDEMKIHVDLNDKNHTARENLIAFSVSEINDLVSVKENFPLLLDDIKRFYRSKFEGLKTTAPHVYVWLDEMAGQLRASLYFENDKGGLPFRREFDVTEDIHYFAESYQQLTSEEESDIDRLIVLWLAL